MQLPLDIELYLSGMPSIEPGRISYLVGSGVGMVWDNQDTDELQDHDHIVALLIRPDILH